MEIKVLNRGEAEQAMSDWKEMYPELPHIDDGYRYIRNDIHDINNNVRESLKKDESRKRNESYYIDAHVGLGLYDYLWKQPGFTMRAAADDGFWRYMSVKVVPDIVAQRWGRENNDHFWSKPSRNWLRSIWWYVHLSWQGTQEATAELLEKPQFSTDTILNFIERNGRKGVSVETYRSIMYYYGKLSELDLKEYDKHKKGIRDDLFRAVMRLNTAKMMVMEPSLYLGGEKAYVADLYKDLGVKLNAT